MTNATAMIPISFFPQVCKDRAVIAVIGVTAADFLQNLLTVDILAIGDGAGGYGALLSPQGKILHDMFVIRDGETIFLDCDHEQMSALLQKLTFYRLRAKLELKIREDLEIGVSLAPIEDRLAYQDPRHPSLGWRAVAPMGTFWQGNGYAEYCRAIGIPSANAIVGQFAHEANLDQLNGLAFAKGCYVGQEIVSRMEHRGTARSRILPFQGNAIAGAEIRSNDVLMGQVREPGIGLFRIDRLVETSSPLVANGVAIHVGKPSWLKIDLIIPEIAQ